MAEKRIKIAQMINYLERAGKELGVVKLLNHLDPQRFDCTLVVVNKILDESLLNPDRFETICLEQPHGNNWRLPFMYKRFFQQHQFDIVHTRSWANLVDVVLGAKMARYPAIIHQEHGTFPQELRHRILQRLFWGMADKVLSVSDILRQRLSDVTGFPVTRIVPVLNGVDEKLFFPDEALGQKFRREFGFGEDEFLLGMVGRMIEIKNIPMIFRALAALKNRGCVVQFVHVGQGRQKEFLVNLAAELGITAQVHFLGRSDAVNAVMNGLNIFTLTSFSEGCSNVIQEAMMAGLPVIATAVGGNPELVQDQKTGILVANNDHDALANAIEKLRGNVQMRRQFSEASRRHALENFSIENMVRSYESIYLTEYARKHSKAP